MNQGAALHDKLVDFTASLESVGAALNSAKQVFDAAMKQHSTGPDNLVRQAEMLVDLGVRPRRRLAQLAIDFTAERPRRLSLVDVTAELEKAERSPELIAEPEMDETLQEFNGVEEGLQALPAS